MRRQQATTNHVDIIKVELDDTDYATATGNNINDAAKQFIYRTHGRKILVDINRVNGVKDPYYRK